MNEYFLMNDTLYRLCINKIVITIDNYIFIENRKKNNLIRLVYMKHMPVYLRSQRKTEGSYLTRLE